MGEKDGKERVVVKKARKVMIIYGRDESVISREEGDKVEVVVLGHFMKLGFTLWDGASIQWPGLQGHV